MTWSSELSPVWPLIQSTFFSLVLDQQFIHTATIQALGCRIFLANIFHSGCQWLNSFRSKEGDGKQEDSFPYVTGAKGISKVFCMAHPTRSFVQVSLIFLHNQAVGNSVFCLYCV